MNVLIIHNQVIPVQGYGGVERIIWWLGKELARLGHQVSYLVPAGSQCPFATIINYNHSRTLKEQIPPTIDCVHLCYQTQEKIQKPYLVMYQYNYHPQDTFDINTVFISKNHAQRNGSRTYVYNGIYIEEYGSVDFGSLLVLLFVLGYG